MPTYLAPGKLFLFWSQKDHSLRPVSPLWLSNRHLALWIPAKFARNFSVSPTIARIARVASSLPGTACNLEQRRRIRESAAKEDQGCQLCGKIFKFLEQHYGPGCGDQHAEDKKFEVFLHRSIFASDKRSGVNERCFSMMCFNWQPLTIGSPKTWFSIWADEGMILSLLLIHKRRLTSIRRIFNA